MNDNKCSNRSRSCLGVEEEAATPAREREGNRVDHEGIACRGVEGRVFENTDTYPDQERSIEKARETAEQGRKLRRRRDPSRGVKETEGRARGATEGVVGER